jgi:hypothetical protein
MNRLALMFVMVFSLTSAAIAAPQNSPVAAFYNGNDGYPAWTDRIHWDRVIDMSQYANGANAFQKFENARDELYAQDGGVLYYPSGIYDFSDAPLDGPTGRGLMLKSGVVIRGQRPSGDSLAHDGSLALATVFQFPFQTKGGGQTPHDWNLVGITPAGGERLKDVHDVGVAWVKIVGGVVYFGPDIQWGATWATAGSWKSPKVKAAWANRVPDGTHPADPFAGGTSTFVGAGKGRLVMGCIIQDACVINDCIDEGFGASGFGVYRFGSRIGVYGSEVFVANNLLPSSTKNFIYSQTTKNGTQNVMFDYGLSPSIDVDKSLLGWVRNNGLCPGYFLEGVTVRDNYVYNHGNKGYEIAGQWTQIINNHNERTYLQSGADVYGLGANWVLTLEGYNVAGGASDNMSRAFDLGGRALWIDHNTFNNTGSNPGNDGEGILCQFSGGTLLYSWALTRNVHTQGEGEPGYMGGYDVCHYGFFAGWNTSPGNIGSMNNKTCGVWDYSLTQNAATLGLLASVAAGQTADSLSACPQAVPAKPSNVAAFAGNDSVYISWTDVSTNETAFRVDRSISNGPWTAIAYRPRHSVGTEYNVQAWADYMAPRGKPLRYRVLALDCQESTGGASDAVGPISLGTVAEVWTPPHRGETPGSHFSSGKGRILVSTHGPSRVSVIDIRGKTVATLVFDGKADASLRIPTSGAYLVRTARENGRIDVSSIIVR